MLLDDSVELLLLIDRHRWKAVRRVAQILRLLSVGQVGEQEEVRDQSDGFRGAGDLFDGDLLLLLTGAVSAEDRRAFDAEQKQVGVEKAHGQRVLIETVRFPERTVARGSELRGWRTSRRRFRRAEPNETALVRRGRLCRTRTVAVGRGNRRTLHSLDEKTKNSRL